MKMFETIKKEQGVALMMVLVIAAIVLAVMTAMIYMVTVSTKISGAAKRYTTAMEAAQGGAAIARAIVDHKDSWLDLASDFSGIGFAFGNEPCAKIRIHNSISDWGACDDAYIIDINDPRTYDYMFVLGDYEVYSKISYTVKGNSAGGSSDWAQHGVVYSSGMGSKKGSSTGSGGEVPVAHYEYLYNVEISASNTKNRDERARLSMLYQY